MEQPGEFENNEFIFKYNKYTNNLLLFRNNDYNIYLTE